MQVMRASVWLVARRVLPEQRCGVGWTLDRGSLPFEQNGPKEDIDDLRVVVRICPL